MHWTLVSSVHAMQGFIRRANIAKYRKLLETTTDEEQRRTLARLLAEELRLLGEENAPTPKEGRDDD